MNEVIDRLEGEPRTWGLWLDFDGTISEIVARPSDARPLPGAVEALRVLAGALAVTAIVSGRAASQLLDWLGPGIEIWGCHGAVRVVDGSLVVRDDLVAHADGMRAILAELERALSGGAAEGVVIEDKKVIVALHWRNAADPKQAATLIDRVAKDVAARHGLELAPGRKVVELRPPVELSKAQVVATRAREARVSSAIFVGDDVVDIPAFAALDELAREGVHPCRVAVASEEAPPELLARADLVVDGPIGVLRFLRALAEASRERRSG